MEILSPAITATDAAGPRDDGSSWRNNKPAMAMRVYGAHPEDDIVLRNGHRNCNGLAIGLGRDAADILPVEGYGVAPKQFVVIHGSRRGIPVKRGVILSAGIVESHVLWFAG